MTAGTARQEMRVPGLPEPLSHYTDAVRFADLLFVSGVAPLDAEGRLVGEGDVVAQARQVHAHLATVLEHARAGFADVLDESGAAAIQAYVAAQAHREPTWLERAGAWLHEQGVCVPAAWLAD